MVVLLIGEVNKQPAGKENGMGTSLAFVMDTHAHKRKKERKKERKKGRKERRKKLLTWAADMVLT